MESDISVQLSQESYTEIYHAKGEFNAYISLL
jgi:hypothetical protein